MVVSTYHYSGECPFTICLIQEGGPEMESLFLEQ